MDIHKLILGLALNTKDCINFLKVNGKYRNLSHQLHGAKRNLIRYLLINYPLLECQRVLQFIPENNKIKGHCLIKFSFDVIGTIITFHLPSDKAMVLSELKLTTKKVRLLMHRLPPDAESSYSYPNQISEVINLLNILGNLNYENTTENNPISLKDRYLQRLENYLVNISPLKWS